VTGDGEALRNSTDIDAASPAAISPNATPSEGTDRRGAVQAVKVTNIKRMQY
jgi:hypothetical protein